jgi:hypothetical protein
VSTMLAEVFSQCQIQRRGVVGGGLLEPEPRTGGLLEGWNRNPELGGCWSRNPELGGCWNLNPQLGGLLEPEPQAEGVFVDFLVTSQTPYPPMVTNFPSLGVARWLPQIVQKGCKEEFVPNPDLLAEGLVDFLAAKSLTPEDLEIQRLAQVGGQTPSTGQHQVACFMHACLCC